MSDKKIPKYSWLHFKEKQQIKQFMRENPRTSFRICQKVFEENFQRNQRSPTMAEMCDQISKISYYEEGRSKMPR